MFSTSMSFDGEETFLAEPARLFQQITDLDVIARAMPDLESYEKSSATTMKGVARPAFGFFRGQLNVDVSLFDIDPPKTAKMKTHAVGMGIEFDVTSSLVVTPYGAGSKLVWQAQVGNLKGLIATLSGGLIRGATEQMITKTWSKIREELGEGDESD
jgi:carbon monoxide dehydrogenase subunit G